MTDFGRIGHEYWKRSRSRILGGEVAAWGFVARWKWRLLRVRLWAGGGRRLWGADAGQRGSALLRARGSAPQNQEPQARRDVATLGAKTGVGYCSKTTRCPGKTWSTPLPNIPPSFEVKVYRRGAGCECCAPQRSDQGFAEWVRLTSETTIIQLPTLGGGYCRAVTVMASHSLFNWCSSTEV